MVHRLNNFRSGTVREMVQGLSELECHGGSHVAEEEHDRRRT